MKHLYLVLIILLCSISVFAVGPITGTTNICVGSTSTMSDTSAGGTWTSSNIACATIGTSSGIVTGVSLGTSMITYRVGSAYSTIVVSVSNPVSAGSILGLSTLCLGTDIVLSETTSGGLWSSSNTAVATVSSGTGFVTGLANGTTIITYAVTGCNTAYATHSLTVATPPAGITGITSGCVGFTATLGDSTSGGRWLSSNTLTATIGSSTGLLTGVGAGSAIISYIMPSGCSITTSVSIGAIPSAIIGYTTVCRSGSTMIANAVAGGAWTSSNPTIAAIHTSLSGSALFGASVGTATITYSTCAGCFVTTAVRVSPSPGPITGAMSLCAGANITLGDTLAGGSWSSSNVLVASVGTTSGIVTGISSGTAGITYSMGGACNVVKQVTVTTTPSGAIVGPSIVCTGASISLSDSISGGTWTVSNTNASISSTGVVTGITSGTCLVSYTVIGICGAGYSTKIIGINSTTSSGTIGVPANICKGTTVSLTVAQFGGLWTSSNTHIARIIDTAGILTGVSAGTAIITYTNGCSTTPATTTVTIIPLPTFSGPVVVCVGGNLTLSASPAGGNWISGDTSVITLGTTTGIAHGVSVGGSSITYTTLQGCKYTEMVYANTYPNAGGIIAPTVFCQGVHYSLSDSATSGSWSSSNTAVATIGTGGLVNCISSGTAIISYTISGCAVVSATTSITVNPKPVISGSNHVCVGDNDTLVVLNPGDRWSSSNLGTLSIDSILWIAHGIAAGTCTLYYTSLAGCENSVTYFVDTLPRIAPITGPTMLINGGPGNYYDSVLGGVWSSSDESIAVIGSTNGIVHGLQFGNVVITYTIANMCGVSFATFGIFSYYEEVKPLSYNSGSFQIFPNPVADNLTIHWASQFKGGAGVSITDMLGREVYLSKFLMNAEDGDKELGISELPDGLYMVTIKTDYTSYTTKMVKLKR